jgi:hypothetical protein
MKTPKKNQRGALGNIVASHNRFGDYDRDRVSPKQQFTPAVQRAWGNMTDLSDLWNEITEEQRDGWWRLAVQVLSRKKVGQQGKLDGRLLFLKLNRVLATCGHAPIIDAPPLPSFSPNPVKGFSITRASDGVVFKLKLAQTPVEDIMLFASQPRNPGRRYNSDYAFIGLVQPPDDGESEFTDQYLKKLLEWRRMENKKYHRPLEGAKVFILAVQQVNGWESDVMMFLTAAVVPRNLGMAERKTRRPGTIKPK